MAGLLLCSRGSGRKQIAKPSCLFARQERDRGEFRHKIFRIFEPDLERAPLAPDSGRQAGRALFLLSARGGAGFEKPGLECAARFFDPPCQERSLAGGGRRLHPVSLFQIDGQLFFADEIVPAGPRGSRLVQDPDRLAPPELKAFFDQRAVQQGRGFFRI
jgi:hypothetical protein